ncbi:MAG: signal peptidase I [Eggerthellaceae bacterium]|nr:signal peptidase I [Eggerthellaceae bacterium]
MSEAEQEFKSEPESVAEEKLSMEEELSTEEEESETKSEEASGSKEIEIPSLEELEAERARHGAVLTRIRVAVGVLGALLVVAAITTLAVTLWVPVLDITGDSMAPTLQQGDMIACTNNVECEQGDIIAFYVDNRMLVKRVVATGGQTVNIDSAGNVFVDGEMLDEPYVSEKSLGNCDIAFPYQVPSNCYFVLGDNRAESLDSRSTAIGCAEQGKIACKLNLRFWPLGRFGNVS